MEADRQGLKAIVMSSPAGLELYKRYGFELVSTIDQDDSKYGGDGHHVSYFLVRQPSARSGEPA